MKWLLRIFKDEPKYSVLVLSLLEQELDIFRTEPELLLSLIRAASLVRD